MKLGCHFEKYMKKVKKITNYKEMIEDIEEAFGDKKWYLYHVKNVGSHYSLTERGKEFVQNAR